jgi:hypothetical protein
VKSNLSRNSHTVAIAAFAITLVTFIAFTTSTPLDLGARITKEQALATVEQSPKVDSRIVTDSDPTIAELHWMKLDWRTLDWIKILHYHLFLTATPTIEYGPFWLLEYQKRMEVTGRARISEVKY